MAADPAAIQRATQSLPTGLQFIVQLVPANPFKAAADGNLLPVIVFVTIFAIATATLPLERRAPLVAMADAATDALIRIVPVSNGKDPDGVRLVVELDPSD